MEKLERYEWRISGMRRAIKGNMVDYAVARAREDALLGALKELLRVDDDWHGSVNSEMANARSVARQVIRGIEASR